MASSKDARPLSQHRLSASSTGSSALPVRQSNSRNHSHTVSLGSFNPNHRVTRRKSMSSTAAGNVAAMAAVVKETGDGSLAVPSSSYRRSMQSKSGGGPKSVDSPSSANASAHGSQLNKSGSDSKTSGGPRRNIESEDSAIADEISTSTAPGHLITSNKARVRRASEGAHLVKGDGKRESGGELRCEKCGKGYKHSSCLTKHLWEHTPEWSYTSKLLISKHQQVQLLEAASVLVAMNQDSPEPAESSKVDSDQSSASPAASGTPDFQEMSSTDTTPPPQSDEVDLANQLAHGSRNGRIKRYSSNSTGYSRSYQSAPSGSGYAGSAPNGFTGFSHYHQSRNERRPSTSGVLEGGKITTDEDEASLAAAVELLSCSFGTPRSGPVILPPDVPPVPPLPARFLEQSTGRLAASAATPTVHSVENFGFEVSLRHSEDDDVKMEGESSMADDQDLAVRLSRGNDDYEDEGIFGRMEE